MMLSSRYDSRRWLALVGAARCYGHGRSVDDGRWWPAVMVNGVFGGKLKEMAGSFECGGKQGE